MAFSELTNYQTEQTKTASTVAAQQYYHMPAGVVNIENATITVGSIAYPLITVDSQRQWDLVNQVLLSTTTIPQFIFPRRDDFGIWPIPQAVYTLSLNMHIRDRSLQNVDVTAGTVDVTTNSQTVTGHGTAWNTAMVNRWLTMNDATQQANGYWYRIISVASTTSLTLETSYEQISVSGASYRIGESPELPEEVHGVLSAGCVSDYFAGPRQDLQKGTWWNNVFWTGDGQNSQREGNFFPGGILGAKMRYAGRSDGALVQKGANSNFPDRRQTALITQ